MPIIDADQIVKALQDAVQEEAGEYLEEFRMRTPGYVGEHVTVDIPRHKHPLPGTVEAKAGVPPREYTQELVDGWRFIPAPGGKQSVGAVVNIDSAAPYVEYGWVSTRGVVVPGHFMAQNAIRMGGVIQRYAENAMKAMVVSLANSNWNLGSSAARAASGSAYLGGGAIMQGQMGETSVNIKWVKGQVKVTGSPGRGISSDMYRKIADKLADAIIALFPTKDEKY